MPRAAARPGRQAVPVRQFMVHQLSDLQYIKHNRPASSVRRTPTRRRGRRAQVEARKIFSAAEYPDCDFVLWNRPVAETCPKCAAPYLIEKHQAPRRQICATTKTATTCGPKTSRTGARKRVGRRTSNSSNVERRTPNADVDVESRTTNENDHDCGGGTRRQPRRPGMPPRAHGRHL